MKSNRENRKKETEMLDKKWVEEKVEHLNKNNYGNFRALTESEVKQYSKQVPQNDREWYEPYAIREETNDLVCRSDSRHNSSDLLFVKIK